MPQRLEQLGLDLGDRQAQTDGLVGSGHGC
jgi:hypothetical protein